MNADREERRRKIAEEMTAEAERVFDEDERALESGAELDGPPTGGLMKMLWNEVIDLRMRVEDLEDD